MDTLIHADIFFFITIIVVVIVGAALTIALIYLSKILSDIKEITANVKAETMLVREDLQSFRTDIKREGFRLERLWQLVRNISKMKGGSSAKARSKK